VLLPLPLALTILSPTLGIRKTGLNGAKEAAIGVQTLNFRGSTVGICRI
jgi:hypothetical protein